MKQLCSPNIIIWARRLVCISLALVWLTACEKRHPAITEAYIKPDPIVGKIVTLHIEAMSDRDEADVTINTLLPDEINLVEGELEWHGSLKANEPQVHELSICVLRPGKNWQIYLGVSSQISETGALGDSEILNVESTANWARVIPSAKYRGTAAEINWPDEITVTPTPIPPIISAECSGAQK